MGGGFYSSDSRMRRMISSSVVFKDLAIKSGLADYSYVAKSRDQVFSSLHLKDSMNPKGIQIRESRDSEDHQNSLPIIIALDVTGSMGNVPDYLVREGLPHIMENILKSGFPDPQILFLAVGDHECDSAPLQVGQFESNDEMLDKWLTDVYLEGGGGGNDGESYGLAWFFAAKYTSTDSLEKRGKKGLLFTIGDEPNLKHYPARTLKNIMGEGQFSNTTDKQLYEMASDKFEIFHIHIQETGAGKHLATITEWKKLLEDNLLMAQRHQDVVNIISIEVIKHTQVYNPPEESDYVKSDCCLLDEPNKIRL